MIKNKTFFSILILFLILYPLFPLTLDFKAVYAQTIPQSTNTTYVIYSIETTPQNPLPPNPYQVKVFGFRTENNVTRTCNITFNAVIIAFETSETQLRFKSIEDLKTENCKAEIVTNEEDMYLAIATNCYPINAMLTDLRMGNVYIRTVKYKTINMKFEDYIASRKPQQGGGGGFDVGKFFGSVGQFFGFIGSAFSLFVEGVKITVVAIPSIVVESIKVFGEFIGAPGDPMADYYVSQYRLRLMPLTSSSNPYIAQIAREILDSKRPLGDICSNDVCPFPIRGKDLEKTLAQIENSKPKGIIGIFTVIFNALVVAKDAIAFIVKNFVTIHIVAFIALMVFGFAKTIKTRDISHVVDSAKTIYSILKFYFNGVKFLIELLIKFVQAVAQLIDAILPF